MPTLTRRLAALCAAGLAVPALIVASTAPAGALPGNPGNGATTNEQPQTDHRCSPATTRKVAGTLVAPGNLGLNATIGVDMLDRNGTKINVVDGCPSGGAYGAIVQLNHYTRGAGAPVGSEQQDGKGKDKGAVDPHFAIYNLPANVTQVFVETYNRTYNGSPCGLSCAGPLDTSHFSQVNLRNVPAGSAGNLTLKPVGRSGVGSLKLVFNRSDITQVDVFNFSGSGNSNGWAVANPQAGSSPGNASTWIAGSLPVMAGRGYLVEVTYAGRQVHVPSAGATSGYKTHKGVTTTVHVALP